MTDDEMTVLMIASQGESMIPIGRWETPIRALTERGLMRSFDSVNYVITDAGTKAMQAEEREREGDFARALPKTPEALHVDMTIRERNIVFDLTYDGNFMADVATRMWLARNGACEPEVVHLMRRVVRPGDFVIDGGANIGFMTMIMSRLVGDQGHVEAFEPSALNFKKIRANLELNKIENVTVVNRALWSEETQVVLYQGLDSGLSSLMPFSESLASIPCQGLTLDRWCGNYDRTPRFLKLDIEGAEEHALIGASDMLMNGIDFISCEINPPALARFGSTQMDLRDFMASKGYSTFALHEDGSRPTLVDRTTEIHGAAVNLNVLFSDVDNVHEAWNE